MVLGLDKCVSRQWSCYSARWSWLRHRPFFPDLVAHQVALLHLSYSECLTGCAALAHSATAGHGWSACHAHGPVAFVDWMCTFQKRQTSWTACRSIQPSTSALKAITLFTPSAVGLSDPVHMENLQEKAQVVLTKYMQAQYLSQHQCYWHLLLWLPTLRTVTVSLISLCSSYIWWVRL